MSISRDLDPFRTRLNISEGRKDWIKFQMYSIIDRGVLYIITLDIYSKRK